VTAYLAKADSAPAVHFDDYGLAHDHHHTQMPNIR
jgi:hypothetical protein